MIIPNSPGGSPYRDCNLTETSLIHWQAMDFGLGFPRTFLLSVLFLMRASFFAVPTCCNCNLLLFQIYGFRVQEKWPPTSEGHPIVWVNESNCTSCLASQGRLAATDRHNTGGPPFLPQWCTARNLFPRLGLLLGE